LRLAPEMARVLDFGLADLTGRTTVGTDVLLSEGDGGGAAGVVGNPEFISPEQARGRPVTAAGDLYQVGALLYFLLTGQAPYPRASAAQVLAAHITAPPPVPSALVGAARVLDQVVTQAMAKEPVDRFPDAAAFTSALAGALARVGVTQVRDGSEAVQRTRVMPLASRPELARGNPAARWAVAGIVGVALVAVVSTFAAPAMSAHPQPSALTLTPASIPATPTPTPTRASPSAVVTVPTVHGKLAAAERALRAAGLTLGEVARVDSAEAAETVLGQSPDYGQRVARGSAVDLQVASGSNAVPATAGLSVAAALATLESAGFASATNPAVVDAAATVLGTEPGEGVVLRLGVTIALVLDPGSVPTPTASASVSGTPSASTPP